MKRSVLMLSIILIAALLMGSLSVTNAYTSSQDGKTRVLVQFLPGKKAAVQGTLNGIGADIHYDFDNLNAMAVSVPSAALNGLSRNPNIVLIEDDAPRYFVSTLRSETALDLGSQIVPYGIDMVQARDVWDGNRDGIIDAGAPTGAGRTICIIDSGMYTGHEDLNEVSVTGYNAGWNSDGLGHGTHVAGTIAAMNNALGVVGVTPGTVNLYIVQVFGADGSWIYSSTLIDAANKCYAAGANIISMSLSGTRASTTERRGFDALYANGVLSIAAASNDGATNYAYPASYNSVISVGALDENRQWADFSNFNDQVELSAPGVGVLSTVPYLEANTLTVDGTTYIANHIEYSARGTATGALVNGYLCDSVGSWSGKVVLCERGVVSFYDKVHNVQLGGGAAAVIYNNAPGNFLGTLGDGNLSTIIGISLSQENGQYLVANKLGSSATVSSSFTQPANGYEYYDGTSMATPHVSAVAALIWSGKTTATNVEVRNALTSTALDLGTAGRDVYYGYGLVQAYDALVALKGGGGGTDNELHVGALTATKSLKVSKWNATITITVLDQDNAAVSGVVVTGAWSGAKTGTVTCTTGTAGTCSVTASNMTDTSVTYTVTNLAKDGYTYIPDANLKTSITVTK